MPGKSRISWQQCEPRMETMSEAMSQIDAEILASTPDETGRFGVYGGRFVSETLMSALDELDSLYTRLWADPEFRAELDKDLADYVGRPSPLNEAKRWSASLAARAYSSSGKI